MLQIHSTQSPQQCNMLIAFADMTNFAKNSKQMNSMEMFQFINAFAEITGDIITSHGGITIKFIGDAVLIAFSEDKINEGVRALKELKKTLDLWLKEEGYNSTLIIKAHFGEVACGPLGTKANKSFDVMGETVNIAAITKSKGLAITPQVFRKLDKETRALFKKHTPPITYIDIKESHRD